MKQSYIGFCIFMAPLLLGVDENALKIEPCQTITLKNCISKDELKIKKMMKWHYPKHFCIRVNGKKLEKNKTIKVAAHKPVSVEYTYEWYIPWGNKIGRKEARFIPRKDASVLALHFNGWEASERLKLSHTTQAGSEIQKVGDKITFSVEDVY